MGNRTTATAGNQWRGLSGQLRPATHHRQEDGLVLLPRLLKRLIAPRVPIHLQAGRCGLQERCTAFSQGETKTRSSKHHSSKVAYAMLPGCVRAAAGRATLPRPGGWCGPPRKRRRRPLPCSSLLAAAQAALLLVKWSDPRVVFGAKKPRVGHSGERSHYGSASQLHDKV